MTPARNPSSRNGRNALPFAPAPSAEAGTAGEHATEQPQRGRQRRFGDRNIATGGELVFDPEVRSGKRLEP